MAERPTTFVLNPRSANGATRRKFERYRRLIDELIPGAEVVYTERPMHAAELAKDAIDRNAKAVIAVGGDGTVNETVNGFFDKDGIYLGNDTAFGVVTSGTGGDFRRTFDWGRDIEADIRRIAKNQQQQVDVGFVRFATASGEGSRAYLNIASVGLSADVVNAVNSSSKALGAKLSFLTGTLKTLARSKPKAVEICVDGGEPRRADVTFVAVANCKFFGGGMKVAPGAITDDGLFDIVTAVGGGLGFWAKNALRVYQGTHIDLDSVDVVRSKEVTISPTKEDVLLELDGEQPGKLPATFRNLPRVLTLII